MAILPIDIQTIIGQMNNVSKTQRNEESAPLAQFGPELALVLGYAVLVLAVVALVVHRSDRY